MSALKKNGCAFREELRALYDDYRKAAVNVRCCEVSLARIRKLRLSLDAALAISSCSALAALWVWETAQEERIWLVLVGFTAAAALLRLALPLTRKADDLHRIKEGYETLFADLGGIVERVGLQHSIDLESTKLWSAAFKRMDKRLQRGIRLPVFSGRLMARCREEVDGRIPVRALWIPQEGTWELEMAGALEAVPGDETEGAGPQASDGLCTSQTW